jgi:cathepsin A (carboxypeptidase C)
LKFVVTGESYAGHYIPAIGNQILLGNEQIKRHNPHKLSNINLDSVAIGNGLTDPLVQYEFYADMACDTKYGPVLSEVFQYLINRMNVKVCVENTLLVLD